MYAGPDAFRKARQMEIGRSIHPVVLDLDGIAAPAGPPGTEHRPVSDRTDGRPRRSGVIDGRMRLHLAADGMPPVVRETGADAGELERCLEEGLLQAGSVRGPVAARAVTRIEKDGGKLLPVTDELGVPERIHGDDLVLTDTLAVQGTETVTLLQAEEIDGPFVDILQGNDQQGGNVDPAQVVPEGGRNRNIHCLDLPFHGPFVTPFLNNS